MDPRKTPSPQIVQMDPLTKREIDRRLDRVVAEVAGEPGGDGARPQWIEPAELVRRMSRYLVYN